MNRSNQHAPRGRRSAPLVALLVLASFVVAPPAANAAVSIEKASLSSGSLVVEGRGAQPNANVTVTSPESTASSRAGSDGRYRVRASNYRASTCRVTVSDGPSSAVATLSGCTPTSTTPPPTTTARLTPDVAEIGPGYVGSDFTTFSSTTSTITFGPDTLGPVRFEITAGALPAGLALVDPNAGFTPAKSIHASVSGTPTTVQTSTFTIRATDANGLTATRTYTIVINPARTLDIVPQPWAPMKVGEHSNLWIDGTGGARPYTWVRSAGQFPPGMSLVQDNPDGPLVRIAGTPTTPGTYTFTLRLTDSLGSTVSRTFSATVPEPNTTPPPNAPTPLAPANGAQVTTPFTISWSSEIDPASINGGYNWQVSTSSTFGSLAAQDSTRTDVTQATVSGLPVGTYFWRVQAVDAQLRSSAFSAPSSFTITGASTSQPGTPVLSLPSYGASFHPFESFSLSWTAAERAVKYELLASKDSSFPASSMKFDNITGTSRGLTIGDFCDGCEQGVYFARVVAIDSAGNRGVPSNVVQFTISYDAPLPPAPSAVSPANGATVSLPVTLDWSDVPNPQDTGYEVEISRNSSFSDIEEHIPQITPSERRVLSLTAGTKFWRVRSHQGMASPTVSATTNWSATRSFIVASAVTVESVWLGAPPCQNPCAGADTLVSGQEITGSVQLAAAAPAGGSVVTLASNPAAGAAHPDTVTVPEGTAFTTFRLFAGEVAEDTPVTLTASLGSSSASFAFTVKPRAVSLSSVAVSPSTVTGGSGSTGTVTLSAAAPAGGAAVSLSDDSSAVTVPASVTVPAGATSVTFPVTTSTVTASASATITGSYGGASRSAALTVNPAAAPQVSLSALTVSPSTVTGGAGSTGTVTLSAAAPAGGASVSLSDNSAAVTVPASVTVPAGATSVTFPVTTSAVTASASATITGAHGGASRSATLTVNPAASPTDTVGVQRAEYDSGKRSIRVEATSTSSTATLRVHVSSSGELVGTLTNNGSGRYSGELPVSTNPQSITVKSSLGGSATRAVVAR